MNLKSLATMWDVIAPALANHLWQSTLFAVAAGLLTLLLRNNQARGRYWLWLAASVKFLVPFSVLVAIGSHLAWWRGATVSNASFFVAVEEVSQPFTQPAIPPVPHAAAASASSAATSHFVPAILAGLWFCGFVTVLVSWCVRWRRVSAAVRTSVPLNEGREVEALRRVAQVAGVRKPIDILLSRSMLEPGIFGMSRPVLIWPHGISEYLEGAHLDAVLAHELWHVRRRDNLTAAIHMAVEAIFWFYPPVWWLGARLVEERERACDEEVMQSSGERRIYAESILKVCEFCVGSPLACVSGVTGADLKKRMVHIMSEHMAQKLEYSKKVLLWVAALVVVIAPIVFGLVNATPSAAQSDSTSAALSLFTSVSVRPSQASAAVGPDQNGDKAKTFFLTAGGDAGANPTYAGSNQRMVRMFYSPDGYTAANVTLRDLIEEAYGVQADQIVGEPDWLNIARFDVQAKVDKVRVNPANREEMEQSRVENQKRLQMLLADQFKLVLSTQNKNLSTYDLVIGDGGSKLQPANSADTMMGPDGRPIGVHRMMMNQSQGQVMGFAAQGASTDVLAQQLSRQLGTPVIDKTGLKGDYDFNLQWAAPRKDSSPESEAVPDATSIAALLSAVQQQLGLKLEPQSGPIQVFVIEHVVKPAEE